MSITVQSRAWTEGKIRGNLCVLANNRTRGIRRTRGHGAPRYPHPLLFPPLSLSLSLPRLSAACLDPLTPIFRIVSHKVKSISPESDRPEFHQYICIHILCHVSEARYPSSWNDKRSYFPSLPPSYFPSPLFVRFIIIIYTCCRLYLATKNGRRSWFVNLIFSRRLSYCIRCSSK